MIEVSLNDERASYGYDEHGLCITRSRGIVKQVKWLRGAEVEVFEAEINLIRRLSGGDKHIFVAITDRFKSWRNL